MTRWERELKAIVKAACPDFDLTKTRRGHFKVTLRGPGGQQVAYFGGVLKDARAVHNVRTEVRRCAQSIGVCQ